MEIHSRRFLRQKILENTKHTIDVQLLTTRKQKSGKP